MNTINDERIVRDTSGIEWLSPTRGGLYRTPHILAQRNCGENSPKPLSSYRIEAHYTAATPRDQTETVELPTCDLEIRRSASDGSIVSIVFVRVNEVWRSDRRNNLGDLGAFCNYVSDADWWTAVTLIADSNPHLPVILREHV